MDCVTALDLARPGARLVLAGEFDAAASIDLRPRLATAVVSGCIFFRIDASEVTFVDGTALDLLVWLRRSVEALGGEAVVVAASDTFRWSAGVAHVREQLGLDEPPREPPGPETSWD